MARHQSLFKKNNSYPYGWGLKGFGYAYGYEYISRFRPAKILEVGAGLNIFFAARCRELGIEYWVCDDGSFYSDEVITKHSNQSGVTFVQGQVGQYLEALPTDYFDLILSVSVVEHVPQDTLNDFYADIMRMLKKPTACVRSTEGGAEG